MTDFRDIEALATSNQKISAIKEYRALTGVGLKEAKDAVEHFQAHGQWPAGSSSAAPMTVAAMSEPVASEPVARPRPRQVIEQLVAEGQIIGAIKEVRTVTHWGLKESKDAVDAYRERGAWSVEALVAFGEPPLSPVQTAPAPQPAPPRPPATIVQDPGLAPVLHAIAAHLGHAPHVHLTASARHLGHDGHLLMLRDRTCFVRHERGQWLIDPILFYDAVHHVEIGHGARPILFVSAGHVHERFELGAAEADAALALFRVFAP